MKRAPAILLATVLFLFFNLAAVPPEPQASVTAAEFDVLITGGLVLDGTLKNPFPADIGIKQGRIVRIAPRIRGRAAQVINARGLHVTPGFIDLHTHVDRGLYFREKRAALSDLAQGVTTVVVGQCGSSAWPIFEQASDQIRRFKEEGVGLNVALLVGHGQVRELVMGMENREPAPAELERMKALVREAMEQGAVGISSGLIYRPGSFAKTDEVLEVVKAVAPFGGIYHSHIRNERDKLLDAVRECIAIAEGAGVRANISHFKVIGKGNWGLSGEAGRIVEAARSRGLKITADQYPYRFANTVPYSPIVPRAVWTGGDEDAGLETTDLEKAFSHLRDDELLALYAKATPYFPLSKPHLDFLGGLPRDRYVSLVASEVLEARIRGPENERERTLFIRRLSQPETGRLIREAVRKYIEGIGPENIIVGIAADKSLEGRSLAAIASRKGQSVEDAAIELELAGTLAIPFNMCEPDIETIMKKDYVATGSDGILPVYGIDRPHVRSYATFLYKIKEYALKRKTISLAHAVRSQTSLPAEIMNWPDRGRIAEGAAADIVVLDLAGIEVPSSISNPHALSRGVRYLLINGEIVLDRGEWTGKLPGLVLGR